MSQHFRVVEHVVEASHIRGEPFTLLNPDDDVLHLAVKQYIPLNNPSPQPGDVTIIAAHANGFPKELYEPLWDALLDLSEKNGFKIRGIWIADMIDQGYSSVLNENQLGNDISWEDHPRDLLNVINHFRKEMPKPIVGVAHSIGGYHLATLSLMHPRLFETMILMDPIIMKTFNPKGSGDVLAMLSLVRKDKWPSKEAAGQALRKNMFFQGWNQDVFDLFLQHGLRDLPTKLYPDDTQGVTLRTTKHHEVLTFVRPLPKYLPDTELPIEETHADFEAQYETPLGGTYRSCIFTTADRLPLLKPGVLYIFGDKSLNSDEENMKHKLTVTGTGLGGSGGQKAGRVKGHVTKNTGHLIPMESVDGTAEVAAEWLGKELERWRRVDEIRRREWSRLPEIEKHTTPQKLQGKFLTTLSKMREAQDAKKKARENGAVNKKESKI